MRKKRQPDWSKPIRITIAATIFMLLPVGLLSGLSRAWGQGLEAGPSHPSLSFPAPEVNLRSPLPEAPIPAGRSEPAITEGTSFTAIDNCIRAGMADDNIPGAAVAVIDQGQLFYEKGYGVKHRRQGGFVDANTRFRFGSILKMMTAAAVMQQVEQGKVNLDTAVTHYIPEFVVAGPPAADGITVQHLLTHSSTFPDRYNAELFALNGPTTVTALSDWAASQSDIPLHAIPGAFWNYSNPNFSLAGLVVQRASGVAYHQYMKANVFTPAGMTATTVVPAEAMASNNYSYGHYRDSRVPGQEVIAAPNAYDNWPITPAGLGFTRARDLVQFALVLMTGGGKVLTPESAAAMQTPQIDMQFGVPVFYGYGINIYPKIWGVTLLRHGGSISGWRSVLYWAPAQKWAVAVLYNGMGEPSDAAGCVASVMLPLTDETFPDTSRHPAEWGRYAGTYQGRLYRYLPQGAGFRVADGEAMVATVSQQGQRLYMDIQLRGVPLTNGYLAPNGLDNFEFLPISSTGPRFALTFIDDVTGSGQVKWIRHRNFVLAR